MVGLPRAELTGLEVRDVATVRFLVLLPSSHPLAGAPAVRLEELKDERFVDMPRGFGNRTMVDRAFENLGLPRRVQVEVPELTTIPHYVRVGLGVAVVPQLDLPPATGVAQLPLAGLDLTWTLSVITAGGRRPSRAVTALLDLIAAPTTPDHASF
jgi:DNA-binding transcriptional LysR family regulator